MRSRSKGVEARLRKPLPSRRGRETPMRGPAGDSRNVLQRESLTGPRKAVHHVVSDARCAAGLPIAKLVLFGESPGDEVKLASGLQPEKPFLFGELSREKVPTRENGICTETQLVWTFPSAFVGDCVVHRHGRLNQALEDGRRRTDLRDDGVLEQSMRALVRTVPLGVIGKGGGMT